MSKAETYIRDYTKRCSNESDFRYKSSTQEVRFFQPWLTPENALAAVEIAKEEWLEKASEWLRDFCIEHYIMSYSDSHEVEINELIDIFKKKMEE